MYSCFQITDFWPKIPRKKVKFSDPLVKEPKNAISKLNLCIAPPHSDLTVINDLVPARFSLSSQDAVSTYPGQSSDEAYPQLLPDPLEKRPSRRAHFSVHPSCTPLSMHQNELNSLHRKASLSTFPIQCSLPNARVKKGISPRTGPKALDLFSGTNSVGNHLRNLGYHVISLDISPRFSPDICTDICKWDYRSAFNTGEFDLIVASPPCTEYSQAKTTQPRNLEEADKIVLKALEIIFWFKPRAWWIENPKTGYLKSRDFMQNIPYIDVDYCQFADWGYQKPTRIWCSPNIAELPDRVCDGLSCTCQIDTPRPKTPRKVRWLWYEVWHNPKVQSA